MAKPQTVPFPESLSEGLPRREAVVVQRAILPAGNHPGCQGDRKGGDGFDRQLAPHGEDGVIAAVNTTQDVAKAESWPKSDCRPCEQAGAIAAGPGGRRCGWSRVSPARANGTSPHSAISRLARERIRQAGNCLRSGRTSITAQVAKKQSGAAARPVYRKPCMWSASVTQLTLANCGRLGGTLLIKSNHEGTKISFQFPLSRNARSGWDDLGQQPSDAQPVQVGG